MRSGLFPGGTGWTSWTWLGIFLVVILLFDLGGRGLNEPDEGRYAEIGREALEPGHSWLEPTLLGLGHYDKPPLIYGLLALGFRLFGFHEWTARLPSFLGAVMTLAGVGWFAARLYGGRLAWCAVLVAGTMLHIWVLGRWLTPDMFLTGACTLAVAAWEETRQAGGAWRWWVTQVFFWTLALWTKATPALVPLLGLALYAYFAGGPAARRALKLPLLLPAILLLACPWFLWVIHRHPELKDFFLRHETEGRLTGQIAGRQEPVYFYLLTSLVAWLPWWPLAAFAVARRRPKPGAVWRERNIFPELFLLGTGLIVFSLVPSKLQTYTLPLAPWAALAMTRAILGDAILGRPFVIPGVAAVMALLFMAGSLVLPRDEASWGANSSLKPVVEFLQRQHASGIYADRFWASLGWYWAGDVHFTGVDPSHEIHAPTLDPREQFEPAVPTALPPGAWFIHYRKQGETTLSKWLDDPRVPKTRIGDFVVGPID
jgi:4-amino-4-deoxy-L-arabinose transferase-like glycosyltransferase